MEESQFAQEKSDIMSKLGQSVVKHEADAQTIEKLTADLEKLHADKKRLSEEEAKAVEGLKVQNRRLTEEMEAQSTKLAVAASNKTDLSSQLGDSRVKLEADEKMISNQTAEMERMSAEKQQIRKDAAQKMESLTEQSRKQVAEMNEQNKKLAQEILKERKKESDAMQAAKESVDALKATLQDHTAKYLELQNKNEKLVAENAQRIKDVENLRSEKDSDEHVLALELND